MQWVMEVLFSFESSRRVIVVENREAMMGAIEEHIRHRFPERDIAIAPLGCEMPGSTKTSTSCRNTPRNGVLLMLLEWQK